MDFDVNLSIAGGGLTVEASCLLGEDEGNEGLPLLHEPPTGPPERYGQYLFRQLFPDRVRSLYDRCRGALDNAPEPLRLRVRARGEARQVLAIHSQAWELLCDPLNGEFLALHPKIQVVRYLKIPAAVPEPLRLGKCPLEVLVVAANGCDGEGLGWGQEQSEIERVFSDSDVRVTLLKGTTRASIQDAFAQQDYHVLHYIGHGSAPDGPDPGAIFFETPGGYQDRVSASILADGIAAHPSLRLVFLNTCYSATLSSAPHQSLASTVGPALALRGVPAVVAMRGPIRDSQALTFSKAFYAALHRGASVEAAVSAGRVSLRFSVDSDPWQVPVVFSRMSADSSLTMPAPRHVSGEGPLAPADTRRTPGHESRLRSSVDELFAKHVRLAAVIDESGRSDVAKPVPGASTEFVARVVISDTFTVAGNLIGGPEGRGRQ